MAATASVTNLCPNGDFEFRTVSVNVTNLLTNGGFETNTAGWVSLGGATIGRDTTVHDFGSASLAVTVTGAGSCGADFSLGALTPGQAYTASVYVYAPVGAVGKRVSIRIRDAAAGLQASAQAILVAGWQRLTVTYTVTTTDVISIDVYDSPGGQGVFTYYVDGVQVETGTVANAYVETDGSQQTQTQTSDVSLSGWASLLGATLSRDTSVFAHGASSLRVDLTGVNGDGAYLTVGALTANAWYTAQAMVYAPAASVGNRVTLRYRNPTANTQTTTSLTLIAGWQKIVLFFQEAAPSVSAFIDAHDTTGAAYTINLDSVQLETGYVAHDVVPTTSGTATATVSDDPIWSGQAYFDAGTWWASDPQTNFDGTVGASYVRNVGSRWGNALKLFNNADWHDTGFPSRIHTDLASGDLVVREGDEYYVAFSLYFDSDYSFIGDESAGSGHWSIYADIPHAMAGALGNNLSVVELDCSTTPTSIRLRSYGGDDSANPDNNEEHFYLCDFARGRWLDFIFHMLWVSTGTPGSSAGFVEAWVNGAYWNYGAKRYRPLLWQSVPTGILHAANYHSQLPAGYASAFYQRDWRVGRTLDTVAISLAVAPLATGAFVDRRRVGRAEVDPSGVAPAFAKPLR